MAEETIDYLTEIARKRVRGMDMSEAAKVFVALAEFQKGGFRVEYEARKPLELVAKDAKKTTPKPEAFFKSACGLAEMLGRAIRFRHKGEDKLWIVVEPFEAEPDETEEEASEQNQTRQPRTRRDQGGNATPTETGDAGSDQTGKDE